jgi:hypothetical protein
MQREPRRWGAGWAGCFVSARTIRQQEPLRLEPQHQTPGTDRAASSGRRRPPPATNRSTRRPARTLRPDTIGLVRDGSAMRAEPARNTAQPGTNGPVSSLRVA